MELNVGKVSGTDFRQLLLVRHTDAANYVVPFASHAWCIH